MIFVTVGTHEQQFNRLIKVVDELKRDGKINEEIIIQTGYSTYEPLYCKWEKMFEYEKMDSLIKEASIVITHGGPATFLHAIQNDKVPIVVPRSVEYEEHVNDHQVEFVRFLSDRMDNIIPVFEVEELENVINEYDAISLKKKGAESSNNKQFCQKFEEIVNDLVAK